MRLHNLGFRNSSSILPNLARMMLTRAVQNSARLRTSYLEIFDFVRSRRLPTAPSYPRVNSSRRAFHGGSGLRQQAGDLSKQPQFLETYKRAGTSYFVYVTNSFHNFGLRNNSPTTYYSRISSCHIRLSDVYFPSLTRSRCCSTRLSRSSE